MKTHDRRSQWCSGCSCTLRAEKNIWDVIYRGKLQVQPTRKSNLGGNFRWAGESWKLEVGNLTVLACVLGTTTIKGRQLFEEKVHPRENPGYAYAWAPAGTGKKGHLPPPPSGNVEKCF